MPNNNFLPDEQIISKIYEVRGKKVMIDKDLAVLYGVETRILKQAVRRNLKRFPMDFMFEMNKQEFTDWRSQIVMSKEDRMGLRHAPFCFTELGVTMLASILKSDQAIQMNIRIVRVFTKMREMLLSHKEILVELESIKQELGERAKDIELIFSYLKQLELAKRTEWEQKNRKRIGYKRKDEA